jgi:hypothetical protein
MIKNYDDFDPKEEVKRVEDILDKEVPENSSEVKTIRDLVNLLEEVANSTHVGKGDQQIEGNVELESKKKEHIREIEDILEDIVKSHGISYKRKYS